MAPNGEDFLTASSDGYINLWRFSMEQPLRTYHLNSNINIVRALKDREFFVSVSNGNIIQIWNMGNEKSAAKSFMAHSSPVKCLCLTPDGMTVITGHDDGIVSFWNHLESKQSKHKFCDKSVNGLCTSADGDALYFSSDDMTVKRWDIKINTLQKTVELPWTPVEIKMFPNRQDKIAVAGANGIVVFFDFSLPY